MLNFELFYDFKDLSLLDRALTHSSYSNSSSNDYAGSYERLEFLGDAVLGLVAAERLYDKFPDSDEGVLSRARALLVNERSLAKIGQGLNIQDEIRCGESLRPHLDAELPKSIVADVVEALLGAVFQDGGFEKAKSVASLWLAASVNELKISDITGGWDSKTQLQEWSQARGAGLPSYEVLESLGPAHQRTFTIQCKLNGELLAIGSGSSKKAAAQQAAKAALEGVENRQPPTSELRI
jgi:ribonuclease III